MKVGVVIAAACAAAGVLSAADRASADTLTIRRPGAHPRYFFEAEPHFLVGVFSAPGPADSSGLGVGFRGTIELVDNGFVSSINNTVGVGFGVDYVRWGTFEDPDGRCVREVTEGRNIVCTEREEAGFSYLWFPVVMQWNFWLSRNWSVFGEPGLAYRLRTPGDDSIDPIVLYGGGRWHFARGMSLTMRIGVPTFSVGLSMLL